MDISASSGEGAPRRIGSYWWIGLLLISVLTHLGAAFFSEGRTHPDSDYQILEFAQYKAGGESDLTLPWEFFETIRPALQPALALMVHERVADGDPFKTSVLLRFISAALGLFSAWVLCLYAFRWLRDDRLRFALVALIGTFWMLPWFHVRFSSEGWAASLLAISIVCVCAACEPNRQHQWWLAVLGGATLGVSFYLRFPVAFAILGIGLWVLVVARPGVYVLGSLAIGFLLAVFLNVVVDHWFYGEWVFTPWNYFIANIVEGRAAEFGVDPWWYYGEKLLLLLVPPVSPLLLAAVAAAFLLRPRHVLTWVGVCFLIGHSLVGHKETRFLVPLIMPLLVLVVLGAESLGERFKTRARSMGRRVVRNILIAVFLVMNTAALIYVSLTPAHQEAVIHKWIYETASNQPLTVFTWGKHPYYDGTGMVSFFRSSNAQFEAIDLTVGVAPTLRDSDQPIYVFIPFLDAPALLQAQCPTLGLVSSAVPAWIRGWDVSEWLSSLRIWSIYRCGKDASS